jgi:ketosteroid isomerase-like protein
MSTPQQPPDKLRFRAAVEARDVAALADAFTPGAVLRSPITTRLTFQGREQIAAVFEVILEAFEDLHYTAEVRQDNLAFLVAAARVDGEELEIVDQMRLDADGRITELTVFFRPLPATAAALRRLGAGLGRRKGPRRAALISALTAPLVFMARTGDRAGVGLVKPTLPPAPGQPAGGP